MPVYNKPSSPSADSARLNLLEEKVRNLNPGEAPPPADVTAVQDSLTRLYGMTLRGSQYSSNTSPLSYEMDYGFFWFADNGSGPEQIRSIVSVTYGNTDGLNRVASVPFIQQALGGADWSFAAVGSESQYRKSLAGTVVGSTGMLDALRAADLAVAEATFGSYLGLEDLLTSHASLLAYVRSLENRIITLENAS